MNSKLKHRVFDIPQDIIDNITKTLGGVANINVKGKDRANRLLKDRKVSYGQLKRIIHDLQNIEKIKDRQRFDLYGGDLMLNWGKQFLKGERDLISNRKDSRKRADEIGNIKGERKNSHLKKHKKRFNFKIPTNLIKSNSEKSYISPITSLGIFEEIKKIKKLILY